MEPSDRPPVVGDPLALCPLLCIGIPVLLTAGIGSGLALAIGGVAVGGVVLVGLAVGLMFMLRRRQAACCEPALAKAPPDGSRWSGKARPAKPVSP